MPARHFSNVLFPLPLRPTIPKNSPFRTPNETSCSARNRSCLARRSGCRARSLSVWMVSSGLTKVLPTPCTTSAAPLTATEDGAGASLREGRRTIRGYRAAQGQTSRQVSVKLQRAQVSVGDAREAARARILACSLAQRAALLLIGDQ